MTDTDTDAIRSRSYLATGCPDCGSDHSYAEAHYSDAMASIADISPMAAEIDHLRADASEWSARAAKDGEIIASLRANVAAMLPIVEAVGRLGSDSDPSAYRYRERARSFLDARKVRP